jgi:hypothetical protein
MYMGRLGVLFAMSALAFAETEPKAKASEYPVHAAAGEIELGAEYFLHSIPSPRGMLFAQDYLVVEVAIFGSSKLPFATGPGRFHLRVNNGKLLLSPDSATFVVASMKHEDWNGERPHLEVGAGMGDAGVTIGRPTTGGRLPDGSDSRNRRTTTTGPQFFEEWLPQAELIDMRKKLPISGMLFFPYTKKVKTIKKLELIYEGPEGSTALLLDQTQ